ncbi:MAG: hypothetical protein SF052_26015 [Bacteroidia bacterium]|nr:hypothetical protein [Bacteroidia bacterium]
MMMITNKIKLLLSRIFLLTLAFGVSSCLTFEESYTFQKNGSGSMKYLIDMSEIAQLMKMNASADSAAESTSFSFTETAERLQEIKGISKVQVLDNEDTGMYGVTFDFNNIDVLNLALNEIMVEDAESEFFTFFTRQGNTITRTHLMPEDALPEEFEDEETAGQISSLMESMKYKLNFTFAQPVKVVYSGANSELGGKKEQSVWVETDFKTLLHDVSTLNTSIVLK